MVVLLSDVALRDAGNLEIASDAVKGGRRFSHRPALTARAIVTTGVVMRLPTARLRLLLLTALMLLTSGLGHVPRPQLDAFVQQAPVSTRLSTSAPATSASAVRVAPPRLARRGSPRLHRQSSSLAALAARARSSRSFIAARALRPLPLAQRGRLHLRLQRLLC